MKGKNNQGERIKLRRKQLRMSQERLAELTGYNGKSSISRIESGEHNVPSWKLSTFAEVLQTSIAYIVGHTDNPNLTDKQVNEESMVRLQKFLDIQSQMRSFGYSEQIIHTAFLYTELNEIHRDIIEKLVEDLAQMERMNAMYETELKGEDFDDAGE